MLMAALIACLAPLPAFSLASDFGSDRFRSEDEPALEKIALMPAETRRSAFVVAGYPEVLLEIQEAQQHSSDAFAEIVSKHPKSEQAQIWRLVRLPGLVAALARDGRKSRSELTRLAEQYPEEDRAAIVESGRDHFDTWLEIYALDLEIEQAFTALLAGAPDGVQTAFRDVAAQPELMSVLVDNVHMTTVLGAAYRDDPDRLEARFARRNVELSARREEQERAWARELADPESAEELEQAAREFADSYDYEVDEVGDDSEAVRDTTKIVYVERHVNVHPYPYWFGYPSWYDYAYWYPHPLWHHVGFRFGFGWGFGGSFVSVGLPSPLFLGWYHDHYLPRRHARRHSGRVHRGYYARHRPHVSHHHRRVHARRRHHGVDRHRGGRGHRLHAARGGDRDRRGRADRIGRHWRSIDDLPHVSSRGRAGDGDRRGRRGRSARGRGDWDDLRFASERRSDGRRRGERGARRGNRGSHVDALAERAARTTRSRDDRRRGDRARGADRRGSRDLRGSDDRRDRSARDRSNIERPRRRGSVLDRSRLGADRAPRRDSGAEPPRIRSTGRNEREAVSPPRSDRRQARLQQRPTRNTRPTAKSSTQRDSRNLKRASAGNRARATNGARGGVRPRMHSGSGRTGGKSSIRGSGRTGGKSSIRGSGRTGGKSSIRGSGRTGGKSSIRESGRTSSKSSVRGSTRRAGKSSMRSGGRSGGKSSMRSGGRRGGKSSMRSGGRGGGRPSMRSGGRSGGKSSMRGGGGRRGGPRMGGGRSGGKRGGRR